MNESDTARTSKESRSLPAILHAWLAPYADTPPAGAVRAASNTRLKPEFLLLEMANHDNMPAFDPGHRSVASRLETRNPTLAARPSEKAQPAGSSWMMQLPLAFP